MCGIIIAGEFFIHVTITNGHLVVSMRWWWHFICCYFLCFAKRVYVGYLFCSVIQQSHPVCNTIMLFGVIICLVSVILLGIDGRFVSSDTYPKVCFLLATREIGKYIYCFLLNRSFSFTVYRTHGILPIFACRYVRQERGCFQLVLHWPMVQCLARFGVSIVSQRNKSKIQRFVQIKNKKFKITSLTLNESKLYRPKSVSLALPFIAGENCNLFFFLSFSSFV